MAKRQSLLQNKLGYFSKTIFLANIVAVIALLLSYSASFIDPHSYWYISFFGLAYLPILLINTGFIIYWFLRKKRYMLLSAIAILGGWNLMSKHINFRNNNDKIVVKTDSILRVMTLNAHVFKKESNPKENFRDEAIEIVNTLNPDIVCFQEFYSKIRGERQFAKIVKERCNFEDYYFEQVRKNDYDGMGQAIFSKYPIINYGMIETNSFGINRIIFADIKRELDTLRIYNVHLRTFAFHDEDKEFIQQDPREQVKNEDKSKQIGRKIKDAFIHRSEQAHALKKHVEESPYPCILMGDFNDTPMSYSVNLLSKNRNNAFQKKGFGWGVTHYALLPILQIDYILTDKRIIVDNFGIIKERLSDHYPIWADLIY